MEDIKKHLFTNDLWSKGLNTEPPDKVKCLPIHVRKFYLWINIIHNEFASCLKSQKISLKFNSILSCLTRSEFTFPIFINYDSAENLVKQFNLSTDILKDVATDISTIITSQPNFLFEIFGGVQWTVWFSSLILAGKDVMMKKPWTLSEINHKVQKNLKTTEKLPLMLSVQFPNNWFTSSVENNTIVFINICGIYVLKIKLIKIFIHHLVSLVQYSPVKTCLKKTWNAIEPTCS